LKIHPASFATESNTLLLHVETEYYVGLTPILPIVTLRKRSLCQAFSADDAVNFTKYFSNLNFDGRWQDLLDAAYDPEQNAKTVDPERLLSTEWTRYYGQLKGNVWLADDRGALNMTFAYTNGTAHYHIAAPLSQLPDIEIPVVVGRNYYEAHMVLSVLLLTPQDGTYTAQCSHERIHVDTRDGLQTVTTVEDSRMGDVLAYFHSAPVWIDEDEGPCTVVSKSCRVQFQVLTALKRTSYSKARAIYRIRDSTTAYSPHLKVSYYGTYGMQYAGVLPSDMYTILLETPPREAQQLFDNSDCRATAELTQYDMALTTAECDDGSYHCGVGSVAENGRISNLYTSAMQQPLFTQVKIHFDWNVCPLYVLSTGNYQVDVEINIYESLGNIQSLLQADGRPVPDSAATQAKELRNIVDPYMPLYVDIRGVILDKQEGQPQNASLKLYTVYLMDEENDLLYTLWQNYTGTEQYRNILYSGSCWENTTGFGVCQLEGAEANSALHTKSNGEIFDVLRILAPPHQGDHEWSIVANAAIVRSDEQAPDFKNVSWPTPVDFPHSNISIVQFKSFFTVRGIEKIHPSDTRKVVLVVLCVVLCVAVVFAGLARRALPDLLPVCYRSSSAHTVYVNCL
jgi:hypothetical protein